MEVEPIRDPKQISIMRLALRHGKHGFRNDALFCLGINTALRVGDLLGLAVDDVLGPDLKIRDSVRLAEKKTGKHKNCPMNQVARDALRAYLADRFSSGFPPDAAGEPLFASGKTKAGRAISRQQAHHVLASAARTIGLDNIGTHSLRKTFGYHAFKKTGGNLALVQKLLNHESPSMTLLYIGLTKEEMDNVVIDLNLGLPAAAQGPKAQGRFLGPRHPNP